MLQDQAQEILAINNKTYDLIARDFSNTRNRIWPEMEMLVNRYVKVGNRVLDLGCGNGRLTQVLPEGVDYLGIDGSERLVRESLKHLNTKSLNYKEIDFRVGDILELEALDIGEFDVVFMFAVFNHIPSKELRLKVLSDVKKLLKPGGCLLTTNWNLWNFKFKKSVWNYKIMKVLKHESIKANNESRIMNRELRFRDIITTWQSGDGKKKGQLYYRAFTRGELDKLFSTTGFEVVENYYSDGNGRVCWWNGRNIVTVGKKEEIKK